MKLLITGRGSVLRVWATVTKKSYDFYIVKEPKFYYSDSFEDTFEDAFGDTVRVVPEEKRIDYRIDGDDILFYKKGTECPFAMCPYTEDASIYSLCEDNYGGFNEYEVVCEDVELEACYYFYESLEYRTFFGTNEDNYPKGLIINWLGYINEEEGPFLDAERTPPCINVIKRQI